MAYQGSTTPLGANAVWTSGSMSADRADNIVGIVFSNVAGSLSIDQSIDGINWDYTATPVAVSAGTGTVFNVPLYGPFVRLRYVNGGTAQATFRIGAKFSSAGDS